ncbi:hypothetical protein DB347_07490 [Opitutaceae bacterium EW11]|nr:hypothetical protein DB347_07490 [Opitutaceae bacterium EW11]
MSVWAAAKSWVFRIVPIAAGLALATWFGYWREELGPGAWFWGMVSLFAGIVLVLTAALRLISDWRRMKPEHSVDLAFLQIFSGVACLSLACYLGGGPSRFLAPLWEKTPSSQTAPDDADSGKQQNPERRRSK